MKALFPHKHESRLTEMDVAEFFVAKRFNRLIGDGIVSELFPRDFVPSAWYPEVQKNLIKERVRSPEYVFGIERVLRSIDVGACRYSRLHSTSFRMLVFGAVCSEENRNSVFAKIQETLLEFLKYLELADRSFLLSYPKDCEFLGTRLRTSTETLKTLTRPPMKTGLLPIRNETGFSNTALDRAGTGEKFELFVNDEDQSFFEIGTIVCDRFIIDRSRNALTHPNNSFVVCALGLERVHALLTGTFDVLRSAEFSGRLFEHLERSINPGKLAVFGADVRQVVDCMSTIVAVSLELDQPIDKERQKILRKIINGFRRSYLALGLDQSPIDFWWQTTSMVFGDGIRKTVEERMNPLFKNSELKYS